MDGYAEIKEKTKFIMKNIAKRQPVIGPIIEGLEEYECNRDEKNKLIYNTKTAYKFLENELIELSAVTNGINLIYTLVDKEFGEKLKK